MFNILYQDEHLVAIDKPAGIHVHPPEVSLGARITQDQNGLAILRDQIGQYLYPVHRLDAPTTGVLLYALSKEAAAQFQSDLQEQRVHKIYRAVVRGYTPENGEITRPLKRDSTPTLAPAHTRYTTLARTEFPVPVGIHPTTRYSLIQASPLTGRYHQLRRHLAGISHPIIGDVMRGDGDHNRFFKNELGIQGLLLRASELHFAHPIGRQPMSLYAPQTPVWTKVLSLFSNSESS